MTITIQNVDDTLLELIQCAIKLKPQNNYVLRKNTRSHIPKKKEQIIQDINNDIELYKQGKLKTYPHGTKWKYLK